MKIALISDIHGNLVALDAVLQDIQAHGGVDGYWVLGDLAAIGPDPIGVLERLTELSEAEFVRGNTDRYLVTGERPPPSVEECEADPSQWRRFAEVASSISWTQGAVTVAGWREWLADLPLERRFVLPDSTRVLCVHASPGSDDRGLHPGLSEDELRASLDGCEADLVCVGHTHYPRDVRVDGVHVVNGGSVSNVFPPDLRACYGVLEADEGGYLFQQRRAEYDRGAVVEELERVNHPAREHIIQFLGGEVFPPAVYGVGS
jgi:putative phosphoesterase